MDVIAWYERNAARYEALDAGLPGDIEFYVGLARGYGGPVLDIGCGAGRVALAVARAGVRVVGLDASAMMLRRARQAAGTDGNPTWVQADMRRFAFRSGFRLIVVPHRTFQHLLTDEDQRQALRCWYDHLVPGGWLALNLAALPPALAAATRAGGPYAEPHRGLCVRRVTVEEMRALLCAAGFAVAALWGGLDRRPFDTWSTEQVWVARRPA